MYEFVGYRIFPFLFVIFGAKVVTLQFSTCCLFYSLVGCYSKDQKKVGQFTQ